MFAPTLAGNRVGVCGTIDIMLRRVGTCRDLMSWPQMVIGGAASWPRSSLADGGYKPSRSEATFDLPEPDDPTMAVQRPLGMVRMRTDKARETVRAGEWEGRCG